MAVYLPADLEKSAVVSDGHRRRAHARATWSKQLPGPSFPNDRRDRI